jgi:hypothetical protein
MTDRERVPWLRLWKANLERTIPGAWNRDVSLAIDRTMVFIEATA